MDISVAVTDLLAPHVLHGSVGSNLYDMYCYIIAMHMLCTRLIQFVENEALELKLASVHQHFNIYHLWQNVVAIISLNLKEEPLAVMI